MSRRAVFGLLIACLAALAAAIVPWRVSSEALTEAAREHLRDVTGLELAAGPGTVAVLPIPRLAFRNITLTAPNGAPVVRGGALKGKVRILPLLAGRLEFSEVTLSGGVIDLHFGSEATSWEQAAAPLRQKLDRAPGKAHVVRLVLTGVTLRVHEGRTGSETTVHNLNLAADWPTPASPLQAAGTMTWRGEPVRINAASLRPQALVAGSATPFRMDVSAPLAGLVLSGELSLREDQRFIGRAAFTSRSLKDFAEWSRVVLPLGDLIGPFGLEGDVRVDGQGISWPAARVALGGDRLEGALFWRAEGERGTITSTLAAESLDLTSFASLAGLRPSVGGWSSDRFIPPFRSGTELDLRLSAASARIGPVRFDNLAANVSVKPGRYEALINGATVHKGAVKGRAVLTHAGDGIEIKTQSTFERLDVPALLADLGLPRGVSGSAQGQFALEGAGDSPAELVASLHGRATTTIRNGELLGVSLADLVRRAAARSNPIWRGGRTAFEQATVQVTVDNGVAAINEATLSSTGLRASVQGRSSLKDQTVDAKANLETVAPGSALAMLFDITGPWRAPQVVPAARFLTRPPESTGSAGTR